MTKSINPVETLAKLAVTNRPAWLDYKNHLVDRREKLIRTMLTLTEYGDLRMTQGQLAELDQLIKQATTVDSHLRGA